MRIRLLLAVVTICLSATPISTAASIDISIVGDPVDGNSWSQGWQLSRGFDDPEIDFIGFHMDSDDRRFKDAVAVGQFDNDTWKESYRSDRLAAAKGDHSWDRLQLRTYFDDDRDDLSFKMVLYKKGDNYGYQEIKLSYKLGYGWNKEVRDWDQIVGLYCTNEYTETNSEAVPEPSSLAAFAGLALMGLIGARRNRRKLM